MISNNFRTWSSIWRCCAVTQTRESIPGVSFNWRTTGAILTASGRVPNTERIFKLYYPIYTDRSKLRFRSGMRNL